MWPSTIRASAGQAPCCFKRAFRSQSMRRPVIASGAYRRCIAHASTTHQTDARNHDHALGRAGSQTAPGKPGAIPKRNALSKPSLRRAARESATSRSKRGPNDASTPEAGDAEKSVTAFCGAEEYDMMAVARILRFEGVPIDPTGTSLYPEVIHIQMPADPNRDLFGASLERTSNAGDAFIFPAGTIVAWNVPDSSIKLLMEQHLKSAAVGAHELEDETLEYKEDSSRERSSIRSGAIVLGTKSEENGQRVLSSASAGGGLSPMADNQQHRSSTVLAQIAFSSGLAKSTKIAVLENQLNAYLEDTRDISKALMDGHLGSVTRSFIYQKLGQLLSMRGQLNLSSDLTDAVPDLLWDTEPELGLDTYHERISHELDIEIRIERLNQRMDYAHEIASILREELQVLREERDERKSTRLEWIIILLIAVEVGFGGWHLYQDQKSHGITKVQVVPQPGQRDL